MLVRRENWQPQGVVDLEARAWDALREVEQSVLVTAGAGAGKTEFLAQKAAYLLQTGICPTPKRILAISFKRDAARNLSERVVLRCEPEHARRFDSMTFDAFTKSMLDRFRKAIPDPWMPPAGYQIVMPKRPVYEDFLNRNGFNGITAKQLEDGLAITSLPFPEELYGTTRAVAKFWEDSYTRFDEVRLTFSMINRLVHWMLSRNDHIRIALQTTYQSIFLDEFQDTTHAQFDLLNTAFHGGPARLTAVGDDKQRIMVFAGAMRDAFDQFQLAYTGRRISLLSNWRSHEDLVAIQHVVAQQLDPGAELPIARGERRMDGDVAAIWEFIDSDTERTTLAAWIASEVQYGNVEPHDVALLVRMHANNVEEDLAPTFTSHGLRLRNLAREVGGGVSIQDLLSEDLTALLLPLLRLGAMEKCPEAWSATQRNLNFLYGSNEENEVMQMKIQHRLQITVRNLRCRMCEEGLSGDLVEELALEQRIFGVKN
jgi:superfamily I DNA/RNA helicase